MASETGPREVTHRLDVLGFHCPVPVAKTRETLETLGAGSVLEVSGIFGFKSSTKMPQVWTMWP
jgi:hypothetical protein